MSDFYKEIDSVNSIQDLTKFIERLSSTMDETMDKKDIEEYLKINAPWYNNSLSSFFEAMIAWLKTRKDNNNNELSWSFIATLIMMGLDYE